MRLHKHIGALLANNKEMKGIIRGSAVAISPDLVLTAAQNVWNRQTSTQNCDLKFYPGLCGPLSNSACYDCSVIYYPEEHKTSNEPIFDFALLKLHTPILNKEEDFLPLSASLTADLETANKQRLAIYGYPGSKYFQYNTLGDLKASQWGLTQSQKVHVISEEKAQILHQISTLPGQAGCPIIDVEELSIVAIHKGGVPTTVSDKKVHMNVGRIITKELIEILTIVAKKSGAQMFRVK